MADSKADPVYIIADTPAPDEVDFGFSPYIDTISDLIAYKKNRTPMVIGVYGEWGSGKTSLMSYIEQRLKEKSTESEFRVCKPVWFQAWKYKDEDEILAALLEQIFTTMARDGLFNKMKAGTEVLAAGAKFGKGVATLIQKVTTMDVSQFFQGLSHREKLGFYDEFEEFFKRLIWTYLSARAQFYDAEKYDDEKGVLVIFIDDLDRCPKDRIVGVLETVKLFIDIPGCVFVIGADNGIIIQALEETYGKNAERFMDKIVQVTFNLPRIPDVEFSPHLDKILNEAGQEDDSHLKEYLPMLLPVLDNNPRNFKRFLNDLSLQKGVIKRKKLKVDPKHILIWNLIEKGFRTFYLALRQEGGYRVLEAVYQVLDQAGAKGIDLRDMEDGGSELTIPDSVAGFLKDSRLVGIVEQFRPEDNSTPLKEWLAQFVSLSRMVETPKQEKEIRKDRSLKNHKRVLIHSGKFTYQDNEIRTIDHDYEMDLYLVTNRQFERFIQAGGYRNQDFWDTEGWKFREKEKWEKPRFWDDKDYNDSDQPVVGVSFFEADAYARWLTQFKDDGHTYRLPEEEEWERAARGEKGNIWPWGNDFDADKCNSKESGIGKPTRVDLYPNGISPYGCYDMAGNVWEWTSSLHEKYKEQYILRGGSFGATAEHCRCASRNDVGLPGFRHNFIGFRCARIKL